MHRCRAAIEALRDIKLGFMLHSVAILFIVYSGDIYIVLASAWALVKVFDYHWDCLYPPDL